MASDGSSSDEPDNASATFDALMSSMPPSVMGLAATSIVVASSDHAASKWKPIADACRAIPSLAATTHVWALGSVAAEGTGTGTGGSSLALGLPSLQAPDGGPAASTSWTTAPLGASGTGQPSQPERLQRVGQRAPTLQEALRTALLALSQHASASLVVLV